MAQIPSRRRSNIPVPIRDAHSSPTQDVETADVVEILNHQDAMAEDHKTLRLLFETMASSINAMSNMIRTMDSQPENTNYREEETVQTVGTVSSFDSKIHHKSSGQLATREEMKERHDEIHNTVDMIATLQDETHETINEISRLQDETSVTINEIQRTIHEVSITQDVVNNTLNEILDTVNEMSRLQTKANVTIINLWEHCTKEQTSGRLKARHDGHEASTMPRFARNLKLLTTVLGLVPLSVWLVRLSVPKFELRFSDSWLAGWYRSIVATWAARGD